MVGQVNDAQSEVPDSGTYVAVPGQANIFGAGLASVPDFGGPGGNGIPPTEVVLPAGTGRTLRVLDATGTISFYPTSSIPPDGLDSTVVDWGEWGELTGPLASRTGITMGVFLEDTSPPATPPPPYPCGGATADFVLPEVGQIFCLGDGLTEFSEPQFVLVPDAATRLFIGYADGNVPLSLIDFESGYSAGDAVSSIPMATNQVAVSTTGPAELADVGDPTTAFDPHDTPAGGTPGSFFLTDRAGQVGSTPTRDSYELVFASAVARFRSTSTTSGPRRGSFKLGRRPRCRPMRTPACPPWSTPIPSRFRHPIRRMETSCLFGFNPTSELWPSP